MDIGANFCFRYLMLPTTFDTEPQLRFEKSVITVLVVFLLVAGYSLTVLLYIACPSLLFRQEYVFIPTASVSAFSFLAILFSIASSKRYQASIATCPVSLALSASSATLYAALAFFTSRRVNAVNSKTARIQEWRQSDIRYSPTPTIPPSVNPPASSSSIPLSYGDSRASTTTIGGAASSSGRKGSYMSPSYYANFILNMHPTARNAAPYDPPASEDEQVAAQMAALLRKRDPGPSPDASQSTFRLDWTFRDDDEPDPVTGARRRPTFETPPHDGNRERERERRRGLRAASAGRGAGAGAAAGTGTRAGAGAGAGVGPTPLVKVTKAVTLTDDRRGREDGRSGEPQRAKSREERRMEIELGNMGA